MQKIYLFIKNNVIFYENFNISLVKMLFFNLYCVCCGNVDNYTLLAFNPVLSNNFAINFKSLIVEMWITKY